MHPADQQDGAGFSGPGAAYEHHQQYGGSAGENGAHLNAGGREAKENRQDGPKGGASRNPQGIRGGQRISKKRLKRCAG